MQRESLYKKCPHYEGFGGRVRRLRRRRGISQQTLADFCAVSRTTITEYEQGRYQPTVETLCRLADFFAVSTDYLLGREEPPAPGRA